MYYTPKMETKSGIQLKMKLEEKIVYNTLGLELLVNKKFNFFNFLLD